LLLVVWDVILSIVQIPVHTLGKVTPQLFVNHGEVYLIDVNMRMQGKWLYKYMAPFRDSTFGDRVGRHSANLQQDK